MEDNLEQNIISELRQTLAKLRTVWEEIGFSNDQVESRYQDIASIVQVCREY